MPPVPEVVIPPEPPDDDGPPGVLAPVPGLHETATAATTPIDERMREAILTG
jgi:hypothetical protein